MDQHGITHETKTIYFFQGYKYDRLADAVNYAKKVASDSSTSGGEVSA